MAATLKGIPGRGTFARGIHPPDRKILAAEMPIEVVPSPKNVRLPLLQHIGAPCGAVVKSRQAVAMGEVVARSDAFVSAPVHAPINGKAAREGLATLPNGRHVAALPLKADGDQLESEALREEILGGDWPTTGLDGYTAEQIVQAVREAGIVGLGGAAFPTHVKLTRNEARPTDALLLNGSECEPYLTADYRLMLEAPEPIITGALLAAEAIGAERILIGIEDNKPQAIGAMERAAAGTGVEVTVVRTKYPMGGEKQLIPAVLNREVPTGGLPLDVGVVVINVGTSAAVARAVLRGKPLTHRVITLSGAGIEHPKNVLAPIGISYGELIEFCGGLRPEAARVLSGGPMMGFALGDLDAPVTKGTSGVTVLTHEDVAQAEEHACVRCGRCVDVCPLNLVPTKIALAARHKDWDLAAQYHILACMECGCCAYACPSQIPLVQLIRMGKALLPKS
jgi:Na+-translocating ferredoxin:NAD+ oxidoreductase subunit C